MIRKANATDLMWIKECAKLAYSPYVPVLGKPPAPLLADYASLISAGDVYLHESTNGTPQGFIVFRCLDETLFLENVAVMPDLSGKGIGKKLIEFCEKWGQWRKCKAVKLYTNEKMAQNALMYRHLGYIEISRRKEDGFCRVYFEKSIS